MTMPHLRVGRVIVIGSVFAMIVGVLGAGTASALEVQKYTFHDEFGFQDPAGTLCPFAVDLSIVSTFHEIDYSDNGTLIRIVDRVSQVTTFTNVDTSKAVTRNGVYIVTSYPDAGSATRGLFGQVFDADGNLLFTDAGRIVYNASLDVATFTPHAGADRFQELLCAALS